MAENIKDYSVNYEINVKSNKAIENLNSFRQEVDKLDAVKTKLENFAKDFQKVATQFERISVKIPKIDFDTQKAHQKLDKIIAKLEKIQKLGSQTNIITVNEVDKNSSTKPNRTTTSQTTSRRSAPANRGRIPGNASYRVLGPSMLDSSMSALDFAKGMGIAYGVAGMGTLMSGAISESAAYDNIMKTTRNILATHDMMPNFDKRFREMEQTVRSVGVETKFTSPQVADAAKFLAMAGFNLNDINQSIRPIADIALVGDTELGETADVVTNIMTGYGITPDKVRSAADIMTMTFTMANTTLTEIAEAYKYSASLLSAGGVPFEVATAAMGILGDAGIKGSQAGTTLRTIMANIANPTAKQRKQWEKLGIERLDEYGNVRDLTEIFGELNAKNLSVSEYYNLFHKTAAQGAVSLTLGVEKWNDIVRNNFLSDGVVSKLAEEKKQTVQGLWAQLTSAFTEVGLKVFEEMNEPIRNFLKDTTTWLSSGEALQMMRDLAKTTLEVLQILKQYALWAIQFYKAFKPVIDLWIKFQLYAMPFLGILRGLRAFGNIFNYFVQGVGRATLAFKSLFGLFNNRGNQSIWQTIIGGTGDNRRKGLSGWILDSYGPAFGYGRTEGLTDVQARYQRMYGDRIARARIGNVLKGAAGAGIAGTAGYFLSDSILSIFGVNGGVKDTINWIVSGSAGILGSVLSLTSILQVALPAAVLIGVAALNNYVNKIRDCAEAHHQFIASTKSLNGIIQDTSRQTEADKFLSIVYDRQMDANRAIGEHINLMREQLGLMKQGRDELESQKTFEESHENVFKNIDNAYGSWWSQLFSGQGFSNIGGFANAIGLRAVRHANGVVEYFAGDKSLGADETRATQIGAVANTLYAMGQDLGKGTQAKAILDGYMHRFLQNPNLKDYGLLRNEIESLYGGNFKYIAGSEKWGLTDLKQATKEQYENSYYYQKGLRDIVTSSLDSGTAFGNFLSTWKTLLTQVEQNKVTNTALEQFMLANGIDIFNKERYGAFGSDEFMSKFGWKNGAWNGGTYPFLNTKTGKMEEVAVTADEARKNFLIFHQRINEFVRKLTPQMQTYFDSYIKSPIWNLGNTSAGETPEGSTQMINGKMYRWETKAPNAYGMWYPVDGQGEPLKQSDAITLLDKVHNKSDAADTGKVDQSGYKSMYQSNSAAPKQVIVNIGSLMDVKSIDLSNPDNSAVVENLKNELAQALIDVVHDFDETYHG